MPTTTTHNEVIVDGLQGLMTTNRDCEEGFRTAADGVKEDELESLFLRYAQMHARFAAELEQEVRTYGGDPESSKSFMGTLQSGWLNLKSALTGGSRSALLSECERAEHGALERYEDVLHRELPDYLKEMIRQQHDDLQDALQHLRALRQAGERG